MEHKRLRWQCRRGTKELDTWLNGIMDSHYDNFNANQRVAFALLLQSRDTELQSWMLGLEQPANRELADLLDHIKNQQTKR